MEETVIAPHKNGLLCPTMHSFEKYSFGYRYAFHKVRSSGLPGLPVSRSLF